MNVDQLKETADLHPQYATWVSPEEIEDKCRPNSGHILGGVLFSNGCKVIHVPTYVSSSYKLELIGNIMCLLPCHRLQYNALFSINE